MSRYYEDCVEDQPHLEHLSAVRGYKKFVEGRKGGKSFEEELRKSMASRSRGPIQALYARFVPTIACTVAAGSSVVAALPISAADQALGLLVSWTFGCILVTHDPRIRICGAHRTGAPLDHLIDRPANADGPITSSTWAHIVY